MTATTTGHQAVAAWLASSLNRPEDAYRQWADRHVALLALGRRFSAVRLAHELLYAVAAQDSATTDAVLRKLHGPVIHDARNRQFYALVPSSPPGAAIGPCAAYLGLGHYLGTPRPGTDEPDGPLATYWAVPMTAPGALCDPLRVTGLVTAGITALDTLDGLGES
ncbi:hypothetical protein [Streptomyces sp. NPDC048111]|uniref:hypothetical protein n=1 Tax=Streptomyces sp. NPDC048111 TaxID=3365500 RepID=UPI0037225CC8